MCGCEKSTLPLETNLVPKGNDTHCMCQRVSLCHVCATVYGINRAKSDYFEPKGAKKREKIWWFQVKAVPLHQKKIKYWDMV